jgi:threonine aldolase
MANQIALLLHGGIGAEAIVERSSHIFNHEGAAAAWLSSLQLTPLTGEAGILTAPQIEAAIRPDLYSEPQSRLICIENTHNMAGGVPQPLEVLLPIRAVADRYGLRMHLDGARLWNAAAALESSEADLAQPFDTVNVCLSKGLGAPVGSVLASDKDRISRARFFRKRLGGGMRQAGVLGAAGIYALHCHRERLVEDHDRARRLADVLADLPGFTIDPGKVKTNIVLFRVPESTAQPVVASLRTAGVLMSATGPHTVRAVTHLNVTDADIDRTAGILHSLFRQPVWTAS